MKVKYNRETDIMLIEVSSDKIEYAEEVGPIIVHFSKDEKPVLLEILDSSEFLKELTKATMKAKQNEAVEISV